MYRTFFQQRALRGRTNTMIETNEVVSNSTRKYLSSIFRPYNDLLADLFGEEEWQGVMLTLTCFIKWEFLNRFVFYYARIRSQQLVLT